MKRTNRIGSPVRSGEKGLTLIELLIVVAIMAIIAAVIIPNVTAFRATGTLAAANEEASNVKTAAIAHYAREERWPDDSGELADFLAGDLRAMYVFNDDGLINDETDPTIEGGWGGVIEWDEGGQKWKRAGG